MGNEIAKQERGASLLQKFGNRYSMDPGKLYEVLCKTAFAEAKNQEQVIALLVVADQYKLNPFTREIYAFPAKGGGVVPIVGIDGWLRIINDHPQFDGMEFRESDDRITVGKSNPAPEWMECIIYRKDRSHPTVAREYLVEVYRDTQPWNQTTARFLRHRCIMQCARVAFGFGGIVDPNDAEMASDFDIDGVAIEVEPEAKPIGKADFKKLVKAAEREGYTEQDVLATAATAGHEGDGPSIPEDLARRIYQGMKENPRLEPTEPVADPETGEVVEPEPEEEQQGGYRTPMLDGDD